MAERAIIKMKEKTLNIFYYNVGSCNGCDIEVVAGVLLNESKVKTNIVSKPEKADLVVFTGILTKKIKPYFLKVLKKLPKNAKKIAFGSCAISGNVFSSSYTFAGPLDKFTKIDLYVNGCAPKADEALEDILAKLGLYSKKKITKGATKYWRGELKFYSKKCIGCLTCVYHCPAQTIKVYPLAKASSGKPSKRKEFTLSYEYERCFFCAMCERKCPTRAIILTRNANMVKNNKNSFITQGKVTKGRVKAKIDWNKI